MAESGHLLQNWIYAEQKTSIPLPARWQDHASDVMTETDT